MNYYKNIFSLKNKLVFIVGGSGLIGKDTIKCLINYKARVINLDIKKFHNFKNNEFFDCSDTQNLEENYLRIVKKYGIPDVLINCSYPRTFDWKFNTFQTIKVRKARKSFKT